MNIERLNIIAEWLEDGAPHIDGHGFNMSYWYIKDKNDHYGNNCGTAMCIGGAAEYFFGLPVLHGSMDDDILSGASLLELDIDQAEDLFYPPTYIFNLGKITPQHAAGVIRNLIATGVVDWNI